MDNLEKISRLVRYYILISTTKAGSGHATSSLSAVELLVGLMFSGIFRYRVGDPSYPNNDRLIFSKGHAAPLLYSLWAAAGKVSQEELLTIRKFTSPLEGHPTREFPYTEAATGSLGQGLSIGVGLSLNAKYLDKLPYRTYVLLGDSEMAEGSNWEAMQLAAFYKLDNLVGIVDVNRLGQRGETMYGFDLENYRRKCEAFGWESLVINGHSLEEVVKAYQQATSIKDKPVMIIAKTIKGKGVSFLEDKEGWHGKALSEDQLKQALTEFGQLDTNIRGTVATPEDLPLPSQTKQEAKELDDSYTQPLATRQAYGHALVKLAPAYPDMVVLDAEVSNSTFSQDFKQAHPDRFFEMFIAEQNMVGVAVGLSLRGKILCISTFASFFTRAADQIRMSQYSKANIKFVGSHAGVSIGADGPSQMGLEDIALFRAIVGSVVLYPADHVATEKLVQALLEASGICYLRTTRLATPPLYQPTEQFVIGGCKVLKQSGQDAVTVIAAGITLYEALKAHATLKKQGITIRVIDLYSLKPLDQTTLEKAAQETKAIITVEDHFQAGGLGEAVAAALSTQPTPIYSLAVTKLPKSGTSEELLAYEAIDAAAIVTKVKEIVSNS